MTLHFIFKGYAVTAVNLRQFKKLLRKSFLHMHWVGFEPTTISSTYLLGGEKVPYELELIGLSRNFGIVLHIFEL